MQRVWLALALSLGLNLPAGAVGVFWTTQTAWGAREHEGDPRRYALSAAQVSGALRVDGPTSYSLSFTGGEVTARGQRLRPGCWRGTLARGEGLDFRGARRVALHLPARGCAP